MPALTNVGTTYDAIPASKELGIDLRDFTGITSVTLAIFVNKIGTGIQSWQLWNVTDSAQVGGVVIDDPAASPTGDKVLQQTFAISGLVGMKLVRIRAKSTVAADDPVFYGAALVMS